MKRKLLTIAFALFAAMLMAQNRPRRAVYNEYAGASGIIAWCWPLMQAERLIKAKAALAFIKGRRRCSRLTALLVALTIAWNWGWG